MKGTGIKNRESRVGTICGLVVVVVLATASKARADIGPPIKISMPPDTLPATSGVEYRGVFTVDVREAGTLSDFEIHGRGWTILEIDVGSDPVWAEQGVFRIPFRAVPTDAEQLISLTLKYDGRKVTRSLAIGPAAFARRGKDHPSIRVETVPQRTTPPSPPPARVEGSEETDATGSPRGCLSLRFEGRIVYDRPTGIGSGCMNPTGFSEEGVDYIWVEVMDEDLDWDEAIWSGRTNPDGTFDTGWISWDDCDIGCDTGCDTPDIYLRYECDTGIVNVQDGDDILEADWSWSNIDDVIDDWTGSYHDFGTHKPANSSQMPALHMHNSITRAHRFLTSRNIATLPEVDVLWPDGDNAYYDYSEPEIHVSTRRQWNDGTHVHEYGHHFMYNEAAYTDTAYCNDFCDGDTPCTAGVGCPNPGHCAGCPENPHDAWDEGFPNWMSDLIGRSWADDYTLSDGSRWVVLGACDKNQESLTTCCQDGLMHGGSDALITERFVGALLRDMEDGVAWDGTGLQDDHDIDGIMDSLCLGFDEIFGVAMLPGPPTNVSQFISNFLASYPEHSDAFWRTAYNVSPSYVAGFFPTDTAPPAEVTWADSPTHPLGVGGTMPCITVKWEPPDDDVTGACAYSYQWSQNPAGVAPDTVAENDIDFSACLPSVTSGPFNLADWYISIRAQDCAGNWSTQWSTFGPFTVTECNNNGILDVCEITCDISTLGLPCGGTSTYCGNLYPGACGQGEDCNANLIPDDCDIASGFSQDCNFDGIPDECENMVHWVGGSGSWGSGMNWDSGATPTPSELICINVPGDVTVSYAQDATTIGELSCHENLTIQGSSFPWIDFTITDPSFVLGNMTYGGLNAVLTVDAALDIDGLFDWYGSTLTGAGATELDGGMQLNAVGFLDGHHLAIGGLNSAFSGANWIVFSNGATLQVRPGATYNHQGGGTVFSGWFGDTFDNDGTFVKSAGAGSSVINVFTDNSGLIHVQQGTLGLWRESSSTGDFLGDPGTTLEFRGGNHEFLAGSSIVADNVTFTNGVSGDNNVWGTYNVSGSTSVIVGHPLYFNASANIINYGADLTIGGGPVYFDYVFGAPVNFNSITVTANTAYFNSGDPIDTATLAIGPGTIRGPSDITVSGLMTWNASGSIMGPSTVNANGGLLVNTGGGAKTLYNRVLNNAGTATLLGWFGMSSSAVFNNLATGMMDIQVDGGVIQGIGQTLNNAGTLVKSAGTGTSTISVNFNNTGTVEVQTGELEFYGGYGLTNTQTAGETLLNGGDLAFTLGMPFDIQGGRLAGAGTVTGNVANAGGTTEPGLSTGILNIVGTYTQGASAALKVELGGLVQGTEYDLLAVSGDATLAGTLEVIPINAFEPLIGDGFEILTAGSVIGTFDAVVLTNFPWGLDVQVTYAATSVTIEIVQGETTCPNTCADVNGDGSVDLADFVPFAGCFGADPTLSQDCTCSDMNGDASTNLADFVLFAGLFGTTSTNSPPDCP